MGINYENRLNELNMHSLVKVCKTLQVFNRSKHQGEH